MIAIFEDVLRELVIDSALFDRRVFLMRAPQKPASQMTTPYVVIVPTGPEPDHTHSGPVGMQTRNYQISIFDLSQSIGLALADSLRAHLDGYKSTYRNVLFGAIFFRLQTTSYESDTRLWQIIAEYRMHFQTTDAPLAVTTKG